ncbi:hypothetical protein AtNW77_Chr5g0140411 [Arabidopsis thaliana]
MLKILGFSGNNKVPKDTSFELPDHVTTIERNCTCFHESKTTKEGINLKAFPVKSNSFSLSVIYEKTRKFGNKDLAEHIFSLRLQIRFKLSR